MQALTIRQDQTPTTTKLTVKDIFNKLSTGTVKQFLLAALCHDPPTCGFRFVVVR